MTKNSKHHAPYLNTQRAVGGAKRDLIKENRFLQVCYVLAVIQHLGLQFLHQQWSLVDCGKNERNIESEVVARKALMPVRLDWLGLESLISENLVRSRENNKQKSQHHVLAQPFRNDRHEHVRVFGRWSTPL